MFHLLSPINLILLKENALFFAFVLGEFCYSNYKICRNIAFHINPHNPHNPHSHHNQYISNLYNSHNPHNPHNQYNQYKSNLQIEFEYVLSFIRYITINNLPVVNNILSNIIYNKNNIKNNILEILQYKSFLKQAKNEKMRSQIPLIARWLYPLIDTSGCSSSSSRSTPSITLTKNKIESNANKFNNKFTYNYSNYKIYNFDDIIQNKYNIIYKRFGDKY